VSYNGTKDKKQACAFFSLEGTEEEKRFYPPELSGT
jgi:hypothetical protein